jgi:tetratricopeptide (TPR) repeat protein
MSLTVLAYAAAKSLGVPAYIQEVEVPPLIDRRNGVDFLVGHVNVFVPVQGAVALHDQTYETGAMVIDFEPHATSMRHGVQLTESEILARYYNNRAAEFMLQRDDDLAYAYFKAALHSDAQYGPAYGNLAQLYYRHRLVEPAEALLRHAMVLTNSADAPVRFLQRLLTMQGRDAEAQEMQATLLRRRDRDPYYWLALGREHLQGERFDHAVAALERAQSLTSGFTEVHLNLAAAYWRNGQQDKAQAQMARLQELDDGPAALDLLNKKMTSLRRDSDVH